MPLDDAAGDSGRLTSRRRSTQFMTISRKASLPPSRRLFLAGVGGVALTSTAFAVQAASAIELDVDSQAALQKLYSASDKARQLGAKARAILVFPKITKAGLVIGGQGGEGAMLADGQTVNYYRIRAASFGLQAGAQTFSYALFFITQSALDYLDRSDGWAVGSGPSLVIADKGVAKTLNTTTLTQDVYAVPFGMHGLMAGLGMEGSRISKFTPDA
jgi:lipid-binding SYLF domain-containing protein